MSQHENYGTKEKVGCKCFAITQALFTAEMKAQTPQPVVTLFRVVTFAIARTNPEAPK